MRFSTLRKLVEQLVADGGGSGGGGGGTPDISNREYIGDFVAGEVQIPVNDDVPNQIRVVAAIDVGGLAALYAIPEGGVWDDKIEIDYVSSTVVCEVTLHIDALPAGWGYAVQVSGGTAVGDVHETPIQ